MNSSSVGIGIGLRGGNLIEFNNAKICKKQTICSDMILIGLFILIVVALIFKRTWKSETTDFTLGMGWGVIVGFLMTTGVAAIVMGISQNL